MGTAGFRFKIRVAPSDVFFDTLVSTRSDTDGIIISMPDQINHFVSETARIEPFDRTYDEVMDLLEDARDFARAGPHHPECQALQGVDRLVLTCESLRITTRLGCCLAWLMMQRAVRNGEITADALHLPENRIGGEPVCTALGHEDDPIMPRRLRDLLRHSRALYVRLSRLERRIVGEFPV